MNNHVLVCDFDEKLISRFQHRKLVVRMENPNLVTHAAKVVQEKNSLYTVWLDMDVLLSQLNVTELEKSSTVPIYLKIAGLGNFQKSIEHIRLLSRLRVLVMLLDDDPETYRDLKILSSLFVPSGIIFGNRCLDWDSVADLLSYSVYNKVPHAVIQPFHFVISSYDPQKRIDYNFVYFEDPSNFLHVDSEGRIALSRKDLERGEFISEDLGQLDHIENLPFYHQRSESWRDFFLKPGGCTYCPGWRICLGKFEENADKESGCIQFFSEWMEAAEYYQKQMAELKATHKTWEEYPP